VTALCSLPIFFRFSPSLIEKTNLPLVENWMITFLEKEVLKRGAHEESNPYED
jgi:hypothetical protein